MTVEIRAPRSGLEAWDAMPADDGDIIMKALLMRLKAPDGGLTIELTSPETQWSEGRQGPFSDDTVSWRWTVTPQRRGRFPIKLSASTRIVGRDGLAAERPVPDQTVMVRVAPNIATVSQRWAGWIAAAALGAGVAYFADSLTTIGGVVLAQVMKALL